MQECRDWKEDTNVLRNPVIGIKILKGYGCLSCKYAHDRVRYVTTHMRKVHNTRDEVEPVECSVQIVFASNLRGFWKVSDTPALDETMDEGLLALRHFSLEFQQLQLEDSRSTVGTNLLSIKLTNSYSSSGPTSSVSLDDQVRLGRPLGRHVMASCQGHEQETGSQRSTIQSCYCRQVVPLGYLRSAS